MGVILLVIVILTAVLEAVIWVYRGTALGIVRVLLLAGSTALAAVLSKTVTVKLLTILMQEAYGETGNLLSAGSELMKGAGSGIAGIVAEAASALTVSALVPFVFVLLYLLFKLLSYFVFLIIAAIIKRTSAEKLFFGRSAWSRVISGLLGAYLGILSCSLIASPIRGLIHAADDSGAMETVFELLEKEEREGNLGGVHVSLIRAFYDSFVDSPAHMVCKYTGADDLSYYAYQYVSRVSAADIGAGENITRSYSFPEMASDTLGLIKYSDKLDNLKGMSSYEITSDSISALQEIADSFLSIRFLDDSSKVDIINQLAKEMFASLSSVSKDLTIEHEYASVDEFKEDLNNLLEITKTAADLNLFSLNEADSGEIVNKLLEEPETVNKVIDSIMNLSVGPELAAGLINKSITEYTNGGITELVTGESLKEAGTETLADTVNTIVEVIDMINEKTLTEKRLKKILKKANTLMESGLVTDQAMEGIDEWIRSFAD